MSQAENWHSQKSNSCAPGKLGVVTARRAFIGLTLVASVAAFVGKAAIAAPIKKVWCAADWYEEFQSVGGFMDIRGIGWYLEDGNPVTRTRASELMCELDEEPSRWVDLQLYYQTIRDAQ